MLVREGDREGNRGILTPREAGVRGSVTTRTRDRVENKIIDNGPGGSLDTDRPGNINGPAPGSVHSSCLSGVANLRISET